MKDHFKPHIAAVQRYQTSTGRDLEKGLRLDRNERVANLKPETMKEIFAGLPPHILHVTPDIGPLYQAIARYHDIPVEKLYISQGITECISFLYSTLIKPGENVIVLDPTYPMYKVYADLHDIDYRRFTYRRQDHQPDFDTLYDQIDERTAMVAIANPNLPIESHLDQQKIHDLAVYCQEHGIILIVDEAYQYFGSDTVIDMVDEFSNLFVLRTFSKAWGLAAIRLGYAIGQPQNIEYLAKTRSLCETNALSMEIALYALEHPHLRDDHVAEVKGGAYYLQERLTKMGLKWHGGDYTNGLLIFLEGTQDADDACKFMRERSIYIRGGFEPPYDNCIRVSTGDATAMAQFGDALEEWRAKA